MSPRELESLALSVSRCTEVGAARGDRRHPCHPIVNLQPPMDFQVPEGWAGDLGGARIVFLSSNPSISESGDHQSGGSAELYPREHWSDEDIVDFTLHRFDSRRGWATPEGRFRRVDGSLSPRRVAFWNNVRLRATELLGRPSSPTSDYVMTEVVHCKSKGEKGVASAVENCAARHLDRILAASSAPIVVVLGRKARDQARLLWQLPDTFGVGKGVGWSESENVAVIELGGRTRVVLYLWHPTGSTAPKTFGVAYPTLLPALRAVANGEMSPDRLNA